MAAWKSMSLIIFAVLAVAFGLTAWLSSGSESVPQVSPENASRSAASSANITDEKVLAALVDPNSITVDMSVSVTSANPPVVQGTTNLPDGTTMQVLLKGDMPACFPRCGFMYNKTTVKNGRFTVGAELTGAEKLIPDSYTIEINVSGEPQPHDVQSVIGKAGEHLRGPYVFSFVNEKLQPLKLPWNPAPSSDEYLGGLMIHYTQRIAITAGGEAFLIEKTGQEASREQGRAGDGAQDGTVRKSLAQLGDTSTLPDAKDTSAEQSQAKVNLPAFSQKAAVVARAVPPLRAPVTDLTGTLSSQQLAGLDQTLAAFQAREGRQIAVLIVPTTQPDTLEQYAARVEENWKVRRKGIDDGVLVLVAKDDHKLQIGVSHGLKGVLPDVIAKRIIEDEIVPRFKQGDFYGGIKAGVERIIKVVVIDRRPLPPPARGGDRAREEADQKARLEKESESTKRAQAQQSPALLEYEAKTKPFYEIEGQAQMAYACGLRSWQWNVALMDAAEMTIANKRKNFHLSHEDLRAVEAYFQETYFNAMRELSCETLVNSPTMEKLDRLENLATGGYH